MEGKLDAGSVSICGFGFKHSTPKMPKYLLLKPKPQIETPNNRTGRTWQVQTWHRANWSQGAKAKRAPDRTWTHAPLLELDVKFGQAVSMASASTCRTPLSRWSFLPEDTYFEKEDVLDFMEITKGIGLSTRTALLKWALRAAHFKAQHPLGAPGAVVGGFNLRFRFQKDVLRHFWSRVLETETETETDMHFFGLLACRCAHVEQPSVRTSRAK